MPALRIALIMLGALLLIAPVTFAQQFAEWESKQDLFAANFPGVPTMTSITWETEYGAGIPARVYRATLPGPRTYSVTVVNYNPVQQILTERAKSCPPGAAASAIHERANALPGGDTVRNFAHATADRLTTSADYVRRSRCQAHDGGRQDIRQK